MIDNSNLTVYEEFTDETLHLNAVADTTILCQQTGENAPYHYHVISKKGLLFDAGQSEFKYTLQSAASSLENLCRELSPLVRQSFDETVLPSILDRIRDIGNELYTQLIPNPVKTHMRTLPPGAFVNVSSKDMWIPWEILYDDAEGIKEFWGVRYNVRRLPVLPLDIIPGREERTSKTCLSSGQIKRAINIVGNDLSTEEIQIAKATLNAVVQSDYQTVISDAPVAIHELKELVQHSDLLHFTCHGILAGLEPFQAA